MRLSIARWMARPTRRALAKSRFFGTSAVIGVSTKPGLSVTTDTPDRCSRLRRPWRNDRQPALGGAVHVVALPAAVARDRGDDRHACRPAAPRSRLASRVSSATVAVKFTSSASTVSADARSDSAAWSGSVPWAISATSRPPERRIARVHHRRVASRSRARPAPRSPTSRSAADARVVRHRGEPLGVAAQQEEARSALGVGPRRLAGDGRGGADDQDAPSAAIRRGDTAPEGGGEPGVHAGRRTPSTPGKKARKLSGLMRASLAG